MNDVLTLRNLVENHPEWLDLPITIEGLWKRPEMNLTIEEKPFYDWVQDNTTTILSLTVKKI